MPEKNVTSIVLVQLPKKLSYFTGATEIDPIGGQLCAIYDDGSYDTIQMRDPGVEFSFDSSKEGPTLVTVTYGGQSQMFQAYIREPVIRRYQIVKSPDKREYLAGEKLDLSGLKLVAEYETGEKVPYENLPDIDHTVKMGEAVYPLNINGVTIPIYIKVKASTLVGIRMGKLPKVTEYLEKKGEFDAAGATIFRIYDSGVEEEVPLPYSAVRGFSSLTPGPLTLTVQVDGFTTNFEISIVGKKATTVTIDAPPFKTNYIEGESINMDGIRVSVEYNNGENRICEDWDYEPKAAKLGEETIKVKVGDAFAEFPVTVSPRQLISIHVSKMPDKMQYRENRDSFDVTGAELELRYDYGEPDYIPITAHMVRGFDNRRAGECQIEVQHEGLATHFNVDIIPQQLLGITITQMPNRVDYAPGETFDKEGLVVSGFYDSGILEPLRSYNIDPDRPLAESDVAILVSSMDKTAVIPIKVAEMFRKKVEEPEWTAPDTLTFEDSPIEGIPPAPTPEPDMGFLPNSDFGLPSAPEVPGFDFTPAPPPAPEPEPEKPKKKTSFWGRKLFYPSLGEERDID